MKQLSLSIVIIVLTTLAIAPVTADAQVDLHFGTKGGMIASSISSDITNAETKRGLIIGGFVEIRMGALSLQPELMYVSRGYELKQAALPKVGDIKEVEINYVELPILVKYAPVSTQLVRPHLFAGPAIAVEIGATSYTYTSEAEVSDLVHNVEVNGVIGVGVDIALGTGNIVFDFRYMHGLTSTFDTGKPEVSDGGKNTGFAVMAGYSL
ncbi:MAG: PorT family protein [candidate division Zixibacteria bacterium]|nr:PorT family protein [candidate division Zixibacteria bacterium]